MGPLAARAPVTSWRIWFFAIFSRSHCIYDKKIEWQLSHSTLFLHYFYIKLYSFYHKCAHSSTNIYPYGFEIFFSACHLWQFACLCIYKQFSLQPAYPCFKIDHVWSSGTFSYMFIMYMVIADEDKKMIWKVVFKILTYFLKIRALHRHFYERNADIW